MKRIISFFLVFFTLFTNAANTVVSGAQTTAGHVEMTAVETAGADAGSRGEPAENGKLRLRKGRLRAILRVSCRHYSNCFNPKLALTQIGLER